MPRSVKSIHLILALLPAGCVASPRLRAQAGPVSTRLATDIDASELSKRSNQTGHWKRKIQSVGWRLCISPDTEMVEVSETASKTLLHFVWDQDVGGSNPLAPTIKHKKGTAFISRAFCFATNNINIQKIAASLSNDLRNRLETARNIPLSSFPPTTGCSSSKASKRAALIFNKQASVSAVAVTARFSSEKIHNSPTTDPSL